MPSKYLVLCVILTAASGVGCKRASAGQATAQGRELFTNACSRCHGAEGGGGLPLYDGGPSPRNFRDHAFHASHSDEQIKQTIINGKGTGMPPFGATFDEAQLRELVAQVRSFDPER